MAKDADCSQSAVPQIWINKKYWKVVTGKHSGGPRKTTKHQERKVKAKCPENRKCTKKQMRNKWAETEIHVCDPTVRDASQKPPLTPKEKQSWTVDDWKKVIFSDESPICMGQTDNARTLVWCRFSEIYKDDCLKETSTSIDDLGCRKRTSAH